MPLHLWLQAFYLVAGSKKGISANQLHRTLGVTLKTAWFMSHRIREAMRDLMDREQGEEVAGPLAEISHLLATFAAAQREESATRPGRT